MGEIILNILLLHTGTPCECFIATSLIKALHKKYNPTISLLIESKESISIFNHNPFIKKIYTLNSPGDISSHYYDKIINLSPNIEPQFLLEIKGEESLGFGYDPKSKYFYDILYGDISSTKSIFQIYFRIAGLRWKGEGYSLGYKPKSKNKPKTSGVAIANANLRNFIINKLNLDQSKLWNIPYKVNLFRKIDEINRCPHIITDDFFTLNIALYLRKNVYFLKTIPINTRIELFGKGKVFEVPRNLVL